MNRGAIAEIAAIDPDGRRGEGRPHLDGHGRGVPGLPRRLRRRSATGCTTSGATTRATTTPPSPPTRRSWSTCPACSLAVIDTSLDGRAPAACRPRRSTWLDDLAASGDGPPILRVRPPPRVEPRVGQPPRQLLRHQPRRQRAAGRAGRPAAPASAGYFAGHTHRNRVRRFGLDRATCRGSRSRRSRSSPGSWAEYRVYEGGILQIHRRISSPEALEWTEKTRHLYADTYFDYSFGELGDRCFAIAGRDRRPVSRRPTAGRRRSATCGSSTCRRCWPARGAPATWPTSAPTSSRSSGPARATRSAAMGWRDPRDDVTFFWKLVGRGKRTIVLDLKDRRRARRHAPAVRHGRRAGRELPARQARGASAWRPTT